MTSTIPTFFDTDNLLSEVSTDRPCGYDSREDASPDSHYFNLKDLRNQARALERQILADDEILQVPQWRQLAEQIPVVLGEHSKDLEFVAWYIEALCREEGFFGLARGFELARQMIETHWDHLYPQPDEDGLATRIAPLVGLNGTDGEGTLIRPILSIPLFHSPSLGGFAAWHAEQAAELKRLDASKAQQRIQAGATAPDELEQAVRETPVESLQQTRAAITAALEAFGALSDAMDAAMEGEPQPTTHIRTALERCQSVLTHHGGDRLNQEPEISAELAPAAESGPGPGDHGELAVEGATDPVRVAIESRRQALAQLRRLSEFFRSTEPHSPVSYAIGQAIRWSEMSLPELMQELIADNGAREGFCRVTGVPAAESSD